MNKEIKYVVAVVLKNDKNEFLVVKRPDNDLDLGGAWGFPATSLKPGELPEACAIRICKEKLGCTIDPNKFLGIMYQKRNSYDIFLMDIEAELIGDMEPNVHNATSDLTIYVDQKWSSDPMDLMPSAKHGSCCSSIFLTDRGLLERRDWIASLEGSDLVA